MTGFNQFYYSFSPTIADYERENPMFKEAVKIGLTPLITSLSILDYADSEEEIVGYGISLIALNIGLYIAAPAIVFYKARKFVKIWLFDFNSFALLLMWIDQISSQID